MIPIGSDDIWSSTTIFVEGCLLFEQMRNDLGAGSTLNFFFFLLMEVMMIVTLVMFVIDIHIFKGLHGASRGSGVGRNGTDGGLSTIATATTGCTCMDVERSIMGQC